MPAYCYLCENETDFYCQQCEEAVCEDCCAISTYIEPIEETICQECYDFKKCESAEYSHKEQERKEEEEKKNVEKLRENVIGDQKMLKRDVKLKLKIRRLKQNVRKIC